MPVFHDNQSDQHANLSIQFTPLQSNIHENSNTKANFNSNQYLQQQLKEKDEEIIVLKNDNLFLNQQITKLKEDQTILVERMNQFEKHFQNDSTK